MFQESLKRCSTTTFLYLSHSAVFIRCESPPPCRTREKEGGESDPPQSGGGHVIPDSGAMFHASIRSHAGSLSSLFIPAGRLGTAPRRGRLKKGHRPMETAVAPVGKNPLSPLPGMIPDRTLKGLGAAEAYCA